MTEPIYFERDLSWLQFNHRVLQEAADHSVPLYERLKFLAIYSSNLDEFFRVRVSSLRSFRKMKDLSEALEVKPKKLLRQIHEVVHTQQEEFGRIFTKEILPELESNNIWLVKDSDFTLAQNEFAQTYFDDQLADEVAPQLLFDQDVDVWLDNRALYLVVHLGEGADCLALVSIPSDANRFVVLPAEDGKHCITFVDDIIRANLHKIFPNAHIEGVYAIKLSRDAELYLGDEFTGDLIARLEERVRERSRGLPTRFLYDSDIPEELLKQLRKTLDVSKHDLIPGARYHNFHDFFGFPDPLDEPAFHDEPLLPLPHPILDSAESIVGTIESGDVILHFPYHSYHYIPALIREAANDPEVKAIKITLYRVAGKSEVAMALQEALSKGKQIFAFIEAKARFDEESNLFWGRQLQQAGAHVRYSFPGIKVHSKLLMIEKQDASTHKYLAYLGTGNFNEKTAKLYADHALLTADQSIGREVARVFEMLEGKLLAPQCKQLLVSPFTTRAGFMELIDREIQNARMGKEAWMILKMNSLEDKRMIRKLYEASREGVKVRCIVRGICCLVPGINGLSENIEITSIVDRYLEHARVYIFANDGAEEVYLASADWMTRNLDRRVEVVFPVHASGPKAQIRSIIDLQLADNTKARIIDATQSNRYVARISDSKRMRAQVDSYRMIASLLKVKAPTD